MDNLVTFKTPDYDTLDGLFFALLLKGHQMTFLTWTELTGRQFANQRAYHLTTCNIPLKAPKYGVVWSKRPIAVYGLDKEFINENKDFAARFIDKVKSYYQYDEGIKKGLESSPKPLALLLAGRHQAIVLKA